MKTLFPSVLLTACTLVACGSSDIDDSSDMVGGSSGGTNTGAVQGTGGSFAEGTGGALIDPAGGTGGDLGTGLPFPEHDRIATNNAAYCALSGDRAVCWGGKPSALPELSGLVALHSSYWVQALGADGTAYELDYAGDPVTWLDRGDGVAQLADDYAFLRSDGVVITRSEMRSARMKSSRRPASEATESLVRICPPMHVAQEIKRHAGKMQCAWPRTPVHLGTSAHVFRRELRTKLDPGALRSILNSMREPSRRFFHPTSITRRHPIRSQKPEARADMPTNSLIDLTGVIERRPA